MVKATYTDLRATAQNVESKIEAILRRAEGDWQSLSQISDEINAWSQDDVLNLLSDWPVKEQRLAELGRSARHGSLTSSQQARYEALLVQVAQGRSLLDRLHAMLDT